MPAPDESLRVRAHICDVADGAPEAPPCLDATLVTRYIDTVRGTAAAVSSASAALWLPLLAQVLLSDRWLIIDPKMQVPELLDAILRRLSWNQVLTHYLHEYIVRALALPLRGVHALAVSVLVAHADDVDARHFLASSDAVPTLLARYFEDDDVLLVSTTELLVTVLVDNASSYRAQDANSALARFFDAPALAMYRQVRASSDSTQIARLLDLVVLLTPALGIYDLPSDVYVFDKSAFAVADDPLFSMLVVLFHTKLVKELGHEFNEAVFAAISPAMDAIVAIYTLRTSDGEVEAFLAHVIVELVAALSHSSVERICGLGKRLMAKYELLRSYNLFCDTSDADIALLAQFNPWILQDPESFFDDVIKDLPVYHKRYFPILLNIVASKPLFGILTERQKLTSEKFRVLTVDLVYQLLERLSQYKHSAQFLLTSMPNIVAEYLVQSPSQINNGDIWALKRQALENLLLNEDIDLLQWKDDLRGAYELMKNGRKVRDIQPQVDVADDYM